MRKVVVVPERSRSSRLRHLRLVETRRFGNGVVLLHYERANAAA
jgi:hypothetical protein